MDHDAHAEAQGPPPFALPVDAEGNFFVWWYQSPFQGVTPIGIYDHPPADSPPLSYLQLNVDVPVVGDEARQQLETLRTMTNARDRLKQWVETLLQ